MLWLHLLSLGLRVPLLVLHLLSSLLLVQLLKLMLQVTFRAALVDILRMSRILMHLIVILIHRKFKNYKIFPGERY